MRSKHQHGTDRHLWPWLGLVCACLSAAIALGDVSAEPVRREILAIYDSAYEPTPSETLIHYRAEMPLNHLGYIVDYHDIRQPLPPPETMKRYAAVVTWFIADLERPASYLSWAAEVAETGVRFIILGGIGGPAVPRNLKHLNRVLERIGVRYTNDYVELTVGATIVTQDDEVTGFERALSPQLPPFPVIERISPDARIALEVRGPARERYARSALVVTGPGGAFASSDFVIYYDNDLVKARWIVNPFELFRRALGEKVRPIPDTTTISGRRLYFSHVDGDGWNNFVEIERYLTPPALASEVLLRELIAPYPDLPVSVGLVAGDLDPVLGGGEAAAEIARMIYELPQVEVASHTCTHPFDWSFYEHYDRAKEERLLPPPVTQSRWTSGVVGRILVALGLVRKKTPEDLQRARYTSGGHDLPRAYLHHPFRLKTEVGYAVRETEALAPPGKPVTLYQWSGDTRAFEAVIRATRKAGLRNINGGDSRFDDVYPSVGYVAPLSRVVGNERQIYAVNSNENTYTNNWSEHFHGFLNLRETLDRTESPRRLKGVNIYYHTYSAEKKVSLDAVRTHLDWARSAKLAPIKASRYAAIADGFFSTRIDRIGPLTWRVGDRDGLQTVRFDEAEDLEVDISRSHGVIGSTRYAGSLYVALDEAVAQAVVALSPRGKDARPLDTETASLEEARWLVWDLERGSCGLRHRSQGYGKGEIVWRGMPPGAYRVEARRGEDTLWHHTVEVGADGRLTTVIDATAIEPVEIRVSCDSGSDET